MKNKMRTNESLIKRISTGFNTLTGVLVGVAVVSGLILNFNVKNYNKLYNKHGNGRANIYEVGLSVSYTHGIIGNNIYRYEGDKNIAKQIGGYIEHYKENALKNLEEYDKFITDEEERKTIYDMRDNISELYDLADRVNQLILDDKLEDAANLLSSEIDSLVNEIDEQLKATYEWHSELGKERFEEMKRFENIGITAVIVAGIISIILSIRVRKRIIRSIKQPIESLVNNAGKLAEGDLSIKFDVFAEDEIGQLANELNKVIRNLNTIMKEINSASAQVSMGSNELSNSAQVLAEGATEQASAVEQLTVSLEKIASQTEVNADNALKAEEYMNSTKQGAISGYEKMVNMVEATDEIQKAALAIGNVIKVIDDIAFQTNILALNANVEAARAGVHGKGFAVVADEVRSLAVRSAEAAKETSEMIENSINKAEYGAKLAQETSDSLNKIVDDVVKVAELVNDIANASRDQSSSVQQVNIGIQQVSDVVQTTSATAQECAASSEELASQSQLLSGQVKKFKLSENNTYAQEDSFSRDEVSSVLSDIKIELDEDMGKY